MADILQTTVSNSLSRMNSFIFCFEFHWHWNLFLTLINNKPPLTTPKGLLWRKKGWLTNVGLNSWWWHMKSFQLAVHNPMQEDGIIQTHPWWWHLKYQKTHPHGWRWPPHLKKIPTLKHISLRRNYWNKTEMHFDVSSKVCSTLSVGPIPLTHTAIIKSEMLDLWPALLPAMNVVCLLITLG